MQGFEYLRPVLGAGCIVIQRSEVGTLQITPTPHLVHQALGNGGKQCAGLSYRRYLGCTQELDKRVDGDVFGVGTGVEVAVQAAAQPRVMNAKQ